MIYRLILPDWMHETNNTLKRVLEGEFTDKEIERYNKELYYNAYYLPNHPSVYTAGSIVDGSQIDVFRFVFVDMDLKDGVYKSKDEFVEKLKDTIMPTYIVDSGHGIHAYWQVSNLDSLTFLKFQRRLIRFFNTDEAVAKIYQLMRVPGSINTKNKESLNDCMILLKTDNVYTSEELHKLLPQLSTEDEEYCLNHYNLTYNLNKKEVNVTDKIPTKFTNLIKTNQEVREIWAGGLDDRSKGDFRLGHIMFANNFTRDEAMSVLINAPKALLRSDNHRVSYAGNIVDKIWTHAESPQNDNLSSSVKEILSRSDSETLKGTRFSCWNYLDNTVHGFRLGQVIGLVGGSGTGKTAVALNMFMGFVTQNPDYYHFFIPLEQPAEEIAARWKSMCKGQENLYEKVHVISNYDNEGQFRHLSLEQIKTYLIEFQKTPGRKVGAVVIDHIGALKKSGKKEERQDIAAICEEMKSFAVQTNTLLIMQSQTNRQKAGIGDIELDKDAAYGTTMFEWWVDYLITLWQPLKRCYAEGAPTVTAFKFCKIRHKKQGSDQIKEDVCYRLYFDPDTELLRELTEDEEKSFKFFLNKATNKRKQDKKTDLVEYISARENV